MSPHPDQRSALETIVEVWAFGERIKQGVCRHGSVIVTLINGSLSDPGCEKSIHASWFIRGTAAGRSIDVAFA